MSRTAISPIHFHYLIKPFYFPDRTRLKMFLLQLIEKEQNSVEAINYIFCTDEFLLHKNREFLKHNTYTDIITFQLSDKGKPILSDIYISVERVKDNAKKFQVKFSTELRRVIFHGVLHLCGYKDNKQAERDQMRLLENKYLELYRVSRETNSKS